MNTTHAVPGDVEAAVELLAGVRCQLLHEQIACAYCANCLSWARHVALPQWGPGLARHDDEVAARAWDEGHECARQDPAGRAVAQSLPGVHPMSGGLTETERETLGPFVWGAWIGVAEGREADYSRDLSAAVEAILTVRLAAQRERIAEAERERDQWRDRMWASVNERMVWQHEKGEHAGDLPFMYCPICEREEAAKRADAAEARHAALVAAVEMLADSPDDTQWWEVVPYMDPPEQDEVVEVQVVAVDRIRAILAEHGRAEA